MTERVVDRSLWEDTLRGGLKGPVRARFSPATFLGADGATIRLGLPNDAHRAKCEQHRAVVEQALSAAAGSAVAVELVTDGDPPGGDPAGGSSGDPRPASAERPGSSGGAGRGEGRDGATGRGDGPHGDRAGEGYDEEGIDPDELVDVPPESVKSPIDRLAEAFPGSELVEDRR